MDIENNNPTPNGFPEGFEEEGQFPYQQNVMPVLSEPAKPLFDLKALIIVAAVVVFVIAVVTMSVIFGGGSRGGADQPLAIAHSYIALIKGEKNNFEDYINKEDRKKAEDFIDTSVKTFKEYDISDEEYTQEENSVKVSFTYSDTNSYRAVAKIDCEEVKGKWYFSSCEFIEEEISEPPTEEIVEELTEEATEGATEEATEEAVDGSRYSENLVEVGSDAGGYMSIPDDYKLGDFDTSKIAGITYKYVYTREYEGKNEYIVMLTYKKKVKNVKKKADKLSLALLNNDKGSVKEENVSTPIYTDILEADGMVYRILTCKGKDGIVHTVITVTAKDDKVSDSVISSYYLKKGFYVEKATKTDAEKKSEEGVQEQP